METPRSSKASSHRGRWLDIAVLAVLVTASAVVLCTSRYGDVDTTALHGAVLVAAPAELADPPPGYEESNQAQETLLAVIRNIRNVIMGLLAAFATLLLTIAGVRYLAGGGDPGETDRAKAGLRAAAIGYGLAVLAPVLAALLSYVVSFQ
ncbi:pilin [Phytomonospora endophytica]|uniref:Uncharacterized protein n=1 Tax=Phytomonospora endophytica TaxID=714109 RepID=A0A841FYX5_9ACTN|nr:pilin [Phytomonospora endophytica]MBB6038547.1 hypothetical protein [Phytomonospora endophytica]GIG69313.1 hypothetical protein Pen01_56080 [Phytomonospora endophytica]